MTGNELEDMRGHLMPEGIKWPMFEDNELVGFGDEYVNAKGNVSTLRTIVINDCRDRLGGGYYWKLGKGACAVVVKNGERIKRPPVRAADGKPLEVGQTVYTLNDDRPYTVKKVETSRVSVNAGEGAYDVWRAPTYLTHQRPVLDADGVPIKKGDTVWHKATGIKYRVFRFSAIENRVWGESDLGNFFLDCSMLTHTKPEVDTWQRIEEDAGCTAVKYNERRGTIFTTKQQVARDLVRRCRALAERERGK